MKRKVNVILQFYNFHFHFGFRFPCKLIASLAHTHTHSHALTLDDLLNFKAFNSIAMKREKNVNGLTGIYMPWQLLGARIIRRGRGKKRKV